MSFDGNQRKHIHEREGNWEVEEYAPKNGFFDMPSLIFQLKKAVSNNGGVFQYLVL